MNREIQNSYKYQKSLIGLLNQEQRILLIKVSHGRYIQPFDITIQKINQTGK